MPAVFRDGPYRFFFYPSDAGEPRHVHVERDRQRAKFWLDPVRSAFNHGFTQAEIRRIRRLVERHQETLRREWDEYFGRKP